jgi:type VI secretion system secreted protein VgrG
MPTYSQADRPLSITTPLGQDVLLLVGVDGREGISELYRFEFELLAENGADVAFDKLLGQKVNAHVRLHDNASRYIGGIVNRVSQGDRDDTFTTYRMEVVPPLWFLNRIRQSRIFQALSVPDILKKVFTGLEVSYEIQGTFEPREYCAQYRESDFEFASRLMEEEGIYYFFKHTAAGSTLVLANTPQSHPDCDPETAIYEEIGGGNRPDERVYSWQKTQELRSGKVTLWDASFELPGKHLEASKTIVDTVQSGAVTHKLKVGGNDRLELYDYPGGYANRFDGVDRGGGERASDLQKIFQDNARTADIRMQQEAKGSLLLRGLSTCPQFAAGFRFKLDRHFDANGAYVVTGVEHHAKMRWDYRSASQTIEFQYENAFTAIPFALPFRPPRVTPAPRVYGAQTAVVVGPAGEEIFTDKYGRIKVQFPWDREGRNDGNSSCWLRVASTWAGKQWGAIHIPRIGQEVLVDFVDGDVDQPIVIGSLYNADQMPPYTLPANKTQSGVKSRSSLQGAAANCNEIRFEDKKGSEEVLIHAEKDQNIEVEHDESHWVGHDRTKKVDNDETVKIGHDETVTISNNRSVTISNGNDTLTIQMGNASTAIKMGKSETSALQSIEMTVGQSSVKIDQTGVTIKGMNIQIEGTVMVNMKGLTTTVNADTLLTLKGALTMIN